ncbi:hypothetical protein CXB51_028557 [Gossypium anomalum]|uniref:Aminotransferase-like plant mobile domain-containing protein n=1 Tax=Gossypium anomalum TaxID=47600 RepID=A0A8J5YCP8_9ROSI|nr:hypothetical protein CXB51_028557 [Gossypium anomalum]
MQIQLGLPMDESILTESVQSANWGAICYDLLGVIPDNIYGGRIEMGWLRDTFSKPGNDSTKVERIRYARAYILEMIGGYLMLDLSRNLVHLRWLLKLVDFRVVGKLSWGSAVLTTFYREMCGRIECCGNLDSQPIPVTTEGSGFVASHICCQKSRGVGAYPSLYMYPNMFPFPSPMPSWNAWPNASPFLMTPTQLTIYRPSSQEGSHEALSGSSSHYQSPLPNGIQHLRILYSIKVGHPPNTHNQNNHNPA